MLFQKEEPKSNEACKKKQIFAEQQAGSEFSAFTLTGFFLFRLTF